MSRFRIQTVRLACAAALGIAADPIHANGNTVVLTGDYINISTNNLGGIGNASTPPGIQFDATGTGTFNNAQDYLTPGSPFFGFSVSSAEEGLQHRNNAINRDIAAGWTMDSFVDQSGVAFGGSTLDNRTVWTGTYSNGGNVYTVVQDIGFNDDDRRITFQTTIT
ncbi:MAG: hypothetical protein KIT73_17340, partial [Burkholderiales bacterium]|nr:hypothetical protein [Burkholderiales bacterium]